MKTFRRFSDFQSLVASVYRKYWHSLPIINRTELQRTRMLCFLCAISRYRFTQIAVDPQIKTPGGKTYDVLFVGTGEFFGSTEHFSSCQNMCVDIQPMNSASIEACMTRCAELSRQNAESSLAAWNLGVFATLLSFEADQLAIIQLGASKTSSQNGEEKPRRKNFRNFKSDRLRKFHKDQKSGTLAQLRSAERKALTFHDDLWVTRALVEARSHDWRFSKEKNRYFHFQLNFWANIFGMSMNL